MLIKTESKFFTFLVGVAAIAVATWAAIFSVTGLSLVYSGALLFVAIAMGTLEFSKIIVASYLFRHWEDTAKTLKLYLTGALITLMVVTSGGIYGYLTHAYQGATIGIEKINSQTNLLESSKERLYLERERLSNDLERLRQERQQTIENRNEEISLITITDTTRYYDRLQRQKIYDRYEEELKGVDNNIARSNVNLDSVNIRISTIENSLADKKLEMIYVGAETGPLVYMARIFDTSMDNVMKWFTLVIVLVFDPLAIALVLALNNILIKNQENSKKWIKTKSSDDDDDDEEEFDLGEPDILQQPRFRGDLIADKYGDKNFTWEHPMADVKVNFATGVGETSADDVMEKNTKILNNIQDYKFSPRPEIEKNEPLTTEEVKKFFYEPGGKVTIDHTKQEEE